MLASTVKVAAFELASTPIRKALEKPPMKSDAAGEGEAVAVERPEHADHADVANTCVSTESMFLERTRPP